MSQPLRASSSAIPLPTPLLAPVTKAVLPSRGKLIPAILAFLHRLPFYDEIRREMAALSRVKCTLASCNLVTHRQAITLSSRQKLNQWSRDFHCHPVFRLGLGNMAQVFPF